jgi:hypothetical protein
LAVTPQRVPLGVAGWRPWARTKPPRKKGAPAKRRLPDRESLRWAELALEMGRRARGRFLAVHLMDSEGDNYDLLAALASEGENFVIRAANDRNVLEDEPVHLAEVLAGAHTRLRREVALSERPPATLGSRSVRNAARRARTAQLDVSASTVTICRPGRSSGELPEEIEVNVVHVRERNAPAGQEPVDWVLYTTLPVATSKDIARIVDYYRCRWLVEEYFKALKTGCNYEKAQLESLEALLRYLAMLLPVAWQLLLLRSTMRGRPGAPATEALTPTEISVLRALSEKPLGRSPTVGESLAAVARLGGHIRANGPPGWLVLWRGMKQIVQGAELLDRLKSSQKRDQS